MVIHSRISKLVGRARIMLPFAAVMMMTMASALVLSASFSMADDPSPVYVDTVSIEVQEACSITTNATDSTFTKTIMPGNYVTIGSATVSVTCNDRSGYSVYAIGCSGVDEESTSTPCGNTNLIGQATEVTIPTGTVTDTTVSNWMMQLAAVSGSYAPTILSDTNGSFSSVHVVPGTRTKVVTRTNEVNVNNASQFTTTYSIATTPVQRPDTYIGKVKYTLVHPNFADASGSVTTAAVTIATSNATEISVQDATYDSYVSYENGGTANLGIGGIYNITGTFPDGYEFDSWSATGGVSVADATTLDTTVTITGAGTLTLNGKASKLYMWNATSANCGTTMWDNRDGTERSYTTASINGLCWMTKNLMLGSSSNVPLTSATSNVSSSGYTLPASSTSGFNDFTTGWVYNAGDRTCSSSQSCYGYYSYAAATAGSNPSSGASSYDICPKGWRLPTEAEFNTLKDTYTTGATLTASPWYGVYSGDYNYGSFYGGGSFGYYWSSTAYSSSSAYDLYFNSRGSAYVDNYDKNGGFAVRCVAKS